MSAYRTIDPTARIEQLERENGLLQQKVEVLIETLAIEAINNAPAIGPKKEPNPMPTWSKFLVASAASLLAAGCLAQAGLLWVAAAATGVGVVLLVCLVSWVKDS